MVKTTLRGEKTEAVILAELVKMDFNVLRPFGGWRPYDMAIDLDGRLVRIQCKTGRLLRGSIVFNTCTTSIRGGTWTRRTYVGAADALVVHYPADNAFYLISPGDCGVKETSLRVAMARNNQAINVRWAKDHLLTREAIKQLVER